VWIADDESLEDSLLIPGFVMSMVPEHPATGRSKTSGIRKAKKPRDRSHASFRYGYRLERRKLPNGRVDYERVPLTLENVLHPEFGDFHVLGDAHADDCTYLREVVKDRYDYDRSVVVLSDSGIYWDTPGLRHHCPDLAVIFGVKRRREWNSFHVKTEKVRPSLIVEVTSGSTRVNDVITKVEHYARAGVPYYVIADARTVKKTRRLKLIGYRLEGASYQPVPLDERGRAWLEPVGLWLGVKINPDTDGDRLVLIDPATDEEIGDYTAMRQRREQAEARAEAEAQARIQAEARVRELEAELLRRRGQGTS
jgi:colicin import membrane protein